MIETKASSWLTRGDPFQAPTAAMQINEIILSTATET